MQPDLWASDLRTAGLPDVRLLSVLPTVQPAPRGGDRDVLCGLPQPNGPQQTAPAPPRLPNEPRSLRARQRPPLPLCPGAGTARAHVTYFYRSSDSFFSAELQRRFCPVFPRLAHGPGRCAVTRGDAASPGTAPAHAALRVAQAAFPAGDLRSRGFVGASESVSPRLASQPAGQAATPWLHGGVSLSLQMPTHDEELSSHRSDFVTKRTDPTPPEHHTRVPTPLAGVLSMEATGRLWRGALVLRSSALGVRHVDLSLRSDLSLTHLAGTQGPQSQQPLFPGRWEHQVTPGRTRSHQVARSPRLQHSTSPSGRA